MTVQRRVTVGGKRITLPSLKRLRAYWARFPADQEFPVYGSSSCLIAQPMNADPRRRERVYVDPSNYPDEPGTLRSGDKCGKLPAPYNQLAKRFDDGNDGIHNMTYGQCVALLDKFIRKYGEG